MEAMTAQPDHLAALIEAHGQADQALTALASASLAYAIAPSAPERRKWAERMREAAEELHEKGKAWRSAVEQYRASVDQRWTI